MAAFWVGTIAATGIVATLPTAAAAEPSGRPETVGSVPVTKVGMTGRALDEAALNALTRNQPGAGDKGGAGAPTATPLTPSGTWQVSPQLGQFTWSYPLRVPPVPGGLAPSLALTYSSGAVDGRTSVTNNQASWVGDGWDLSVGHLDRAYLPCKQGPDLCWRTDNATAVFGGGGGGPLVKDGEGYWRLKFDDGSRIERRTGVANGDNDGEHWVVTKVDGTRYFYGSRPEAGSTWTVPVRGDDSQEPCEGTRCDQAWRWNLDKVVDRHGNTVLYGYTTETASYGTPAANYVRGGYLRSAEYGPPVGGAWSARVDFAVADRCVPGSECVSTKPQNWPDVPWNADRAAPSFWITKRLERVTTSVLKNGKHEPVDSWTLEHSFPYSGDDATRAALWLRSVAHTGHVGGEAKLPAVTFEGRRLGNRVPLADELAPLNRYRVSAVVSESGGVIDVKYRDPDCDPSNLPASAESNTTLCYPVRWTPPGATTERTDWFRRYVVSQVDELDRLGTGVPVTTRYEYHDGAAWHYDTSELTEDAKRTWNEFRGFGRVRVLRGADGDQGGPVTMAETKYYRGMDGDTLPRDGRRASTVDDGVNGPRADADWLAGFPYYEATHLGVDGAVLTRTVHTPTWQGPTATRGKLQSYLVTNGQSRTFTALAAGGWRETRVDRSYDNRKQLTATSDLGDAATDSDDRCTTVSYVRNTDDWIVDRASETETTAAACGVTGAARLSATRTSYDGKAHGAAPVVGDPTLVEVATETGFQQQSRAEYDTFGRPLKRFDALDRATTTAYEPETGPVTRTVQTNALGHTVATTHEPAWGSVLTSTDANGKVTENTYDPLGRLTEVWLPNRPRATNRQGNSRFSYTIRADGPSVVSTTIIGPNGNYLTTNTLYDGLLRTRQVQRPASGGGRLITDTRYDSQGRAFKITGAYANDAAVDGQIWQAHDGETPAITWTTHDGAGRVVATELRVLGTLSQRTTTEYGGDRVTVTPPDGGPARTTVVDGHGRTVEIVQSGQTTRYTYTRTGQLATVADAAGNTWRYTYDMLGRQTGAEDVDNGTSTVGYDRAGQRVSTTDSRGITLHYEYDPLGRPTAVRRGDTPLATWTYDTATNGIGLPARSTRFDERGNAYPTEVLGYSALRKVTRTQVVVPETAQTLVGTYTTGYSYNVDGSVKEEVLPAVGDLKREIVTHTYDDGGQPAKTYGGYDGHTSWYVGATTHTRYGEATQLQLGDPEGTGRVWLTTHRQTGTRWVEREIVDAEVAAPLQADTRYTYDAARNITSVVTTAPELAADRQCFRYDGQRRLSDAWTPNAPTCGTPDATSLGGPAPYLRSYTYDTAGNRTGDGARTYTYGAGHRLATAVAGAKVDAFGYDAAGNTVDRAGQELAWDPLGRLDRAGDTRFSYTADGNRLLRHDPNGTTLYLPGQELRLDAATGTLTGTRYYRHGGKTVAARVGGQLTWLVTDRQNTPYLAVDSTSLKVARRRFDPFGAPRGTSDPFPTELGFLGGTRDDATGLTHLGAREYDPASGRFTSVDPLLVPNEPQQLNAYGYANNNPIAYSDPSGLIMCPDNDCRNLPRKSSSSSSTPSGTTNSGSAGKSGTYPGQCPPYAPGCASAKAPATASKFAPCKPPPEKPQEKRGNWSFSFCLGTSFQFLTGIATESCTAIDSRGFGWSTGKKFYYGPGAGFSGTIGIKGSNADIEGLGGGETNFGGDARLGPVDFGLEGGISDDKSVALGAAAGPGVGIGYGAFVGRGESNSGYYFTWDQPTNAPNPFGTTPEIGYGDADVGIVPGL
ncbi:type IV secretion protein Rhs [Virgisporangium aliadipatigenens]|uniref:Type IV secretion protein Rhs n=2 Tax=Virgisporangium aliadipatigenens TaxID=741659 RepID=A0A8J4DSK1_9ACTN|nr:type IV secretion protein Rhs [Virgisporangium aliadipatigenens]